MAEIIDFPKAKLTNAQWMIAELMFGSSWDLLMAKVSNTKDKVQLINSLIERNKSIWDIVKNMRPKYEEKESEDEKLWRFLSVNIIDYGIINEASNSKSIGAIIQAQENEISNNGFGSMNNLSSTFSWIKVIRHLLKYSSTSKFLIQNQLSDLLGIKITKESSIKSKNN